MSLKHSIVLDVFTTDPLQLSEYAVNDSRKVYALTL